MFSTNSTPQQVFSLTSLIKCFSWGFCSSVLHRTFSVVRLSIDWASLSQNDSTEHLPVTAPVHLNKEWILWQP